MQSSGWNFPAVMDRDSSRFEQYYRCYPVSFIDKSHLEKGDKVIMPLSALDRLASLNVEYPLLFELTNAPDGRVSHCGVLEFVADEGLIYLPQWMMKNLVLEEGDLVLVKSASLAKATYVKLQPHTSDFLDISDPKECLETALRHYSCLTVGDTIMVPYNDKKYYVNIVETKPSPAVSVIETDCEVNFLPPLDYKEIVKPPPSLPSNKRPLEEVEEVPVSKTAKFAPFSGSARRLDGTPVDSEDVASVPSLGSHAHGKLVFDSNGNRPQNETTMVAIKNGQELIKEKEPNRFTGKRLEFDLNSNRPQNETTKFAMKNGQESSKEKEPNQGFTEKRYSVLGSHAPGKLVFDLNGNRPQNETKKVAMKNGQEESKEKVPNQTFTGKKYSLGSHSPGMLVFDSNDNRPQGVTTKVAVKNGQEPSKEKEPNQAFTGKKYSLI